MRILVVEDDERVADFLRRGLQEEGYEVDVCTRGDEARAQGTAKPYDLCLLDWSLPGADGLSVLRHWRANGVRGGVILLTARSGVDATVTALDAGADDYMVKPFSLEELLARIRAHSRRRPAEAPSEVVVGQCKVNLKKRTLTRGAEVIELSGREFSLLELLLQNRGELLSRAKILEDAWQTTEDPSTNIVDVYIRALRAKLDLPEAKLSNIETVRGRGYRLRRQEELTPAASEEQKNE